MAADLPTTQPFGLILAGGKAERMGGGDKVLLPLAGRSLLDHVVERIEPQVAGLALSANGDATRFARFGLPVLADRAPSLGPLGGLAAGLDWTRAQGGDWLVSVAGDTPFLPGDLVPVLLLAALQARASAAIATDATGRHPVIGLWRVGLAEALSAFLAKGTRKVGAFADEVGAAPAQFPGERHFWNINTPEDLAKAASYMPKA